jgi:glutathione S-transferase
MRLYWGPHTCAIGIHILLDEIGEPYETEKVDTAGGANAPAALHGRKPERQGADPGPRR